MGGHLGWFENNGSRWFSKPVGLASSANFNAHFNDDVDDQFLAQNLERAGSQRPPGTEGQAESEERQCPNRCFGFQPSAKEIAVAVMI